MLGCYGVVSTGDEPFVEPVASKSLQYTQYTR
jgi:hypothetical protein